MGYRPPSCAGPTYFPVYQGYVDGFVIANNPAMCALAQVMGAEARAESAEQEDIVLLSVGTGLNLRYLPQEDADWGLRQWVFQIHSLQRRWYAVPLIYMMWEGSVELVNYQCRQLLGDRFHRLDALLPKLVDIDGVDQMDLLCEVAKQTDLQPACQWLDTHFMRDLGGKEKERHPVSADPWACGVCVLYGASAQSLDVLDQEGDGVTVTISRADLARRTREAIEQARRGQAVLVGATGANRSRSWMPWTIISCARWQLLAANQVRRRTTLRRCRAAWSTLQCKNEWLRPAEMCKKPGT